MRDVIEQIRKVVRTKKRTLFGRKLSSTSHLFVALDRDGDGEISGEELRFGLKRLGIAITNHQLEAMRRGFDSDGNGQIDMEEFLSLLDPPLPAAQAVQKNSAVSAGDGVGKEGTNIKGETEQIKDASKLDDDTKAERLKRLESKLNAKQKELGAAVTKAERLKRLKSKLNAKQKELGAAVRQRNAISLASRDWVDMGTFEEKKDTTNGIGGVVSDGTEDSNDEKAHYLEPGDDEQLDGEEEFLL